MLAAAVIAAVGGCVACCALPSADQTSAALQTIGDEYDEEEEEQDTAKKKKKGSSRGIQKNGAADDDNYAYEYILTGIDGSGGESSSSPGSAASMLFSPGSPRRGCPQSTCSLLSCLHARTPCPTNIINFFIGLELVCGWWCGHCAKGSDWGKEAPG